MASTLPLPWRAPPLSLSPSAVADVGSGRYQRHQYGPQGTWLVAPLPFALAAHALLTRRPRSSRSTRAVPRAVPRIVRRAMELAPTDFYGLLGLPPYTADKKEIKAAHRRTVKLVHPDILGPDSGDLQVIVNTAYRTLSDDDQRTAYDTVLRRSKLSDVATSQWANPKMAEGLFVDETVCAGCLKCASTAAGTFEVDPRTRTAHVYMQGGNEATDLDIAMLGCPEQAITKVSRKFMPLLEFAMAKSKSLLGRRNPFDLLGLAHCRVLQLTTPQDLGEVPVDAELREEYQEMTSMVLKEDFREARRNVLLKYTECDEKKREAADIIAKNGRPLSQASDDEPGVFVDETACSRCYKCTEVASSTFEIHRSPERGEKAHAVAQDADASEILEMAVRGCPSRAISFVRKAEVPLLELAMRESTELAQNSGVLKGPWEIFEGYLVEDIIRMDLELQNFTPAQTRRDMKSLAETKDTADEISSAAQAIPEDVRQRLWRGIGGDQSAVKELEAMAAGEGSTALSRNAMKTDLFQRFDADGDGFLYSTELKNFAAEMGFEGNDSEWNQEYVMICSEVGCDPTRGVDFRGFSQMVDDEEAGYLEDEELAEILNA